MLKRRDNLFARVRNKANRLLDEHGPRIIGRRVHFALTSRFADERAAVVAGRIAHYDSSATDSNQMFLRRSVHRLEKGLISRPMRETFAEDYIGQTVATYHNYAASACDDAELRWFTDVLSAYFDATSSSPSEVIAKARYSFSLRESINDTDVAQRFGPFVHESKPPADAATYGSLRSLAMHRRSTRWYAANVLDRSDIAAAIEVGLAAPSACNRQSLRLEVVTEPSLLSKLSKLPMGTVGFAEQIPGILVIVGQLRGYADARDRHAIYVDGGLFAQGFVLAMEARGLATCCINWPDIAVKNREIGDLLGLDRDERVVMLISFGVPQAGQTVPRSVKRSVDAVASWR